MRVALLEASHWHVPLYLAALERPGVEVVAVSDREAVKGPGIAERFGCPLYQSYQELLERTKIDFAFVFGRHVDMPVIGGALIDRNIPFAIEKPCGTTASSVATLRARAESAGLYVAVPFIFVLVSSSTRSARPKARYRPAFTTPASASLSDRPPAISQADPRGCSIQPKPVAAARSTSERTLSTCFAC